MRWILTILALLIGAASAQESKLGADFRLEKERLHKSCSSFGAKSLLGCGQVLFTDHPVHIAVGSIAPQNGLSLGLAFVSRHNPSEQWRMSWNADAVGSFNGSWRAGVYMKMVHTPGEQIRVTTGTDTQARRSKLTIREYTVFNVYAQSISLNKLTFFGQGPTTSPEGRTFYGMSETIVGGNAILPLSKRLNLSLLGQLNGRFPSIRGNRQEDAPSIEQLYSEMTAPGLTQQPAFVEAGLGIRFRPVLFGNRLLLNYVAGLQQFSAPSESHYSFRRFTLDLGHEIPLYGFSSLTRSRETNGPDECAASVGTRTCPSITRNRYGSLEFRFTLIESQVPTGHAVPFYLQPTLGGSDINGNPTLPSYPDYRFRAPNVMLFRERLEHSVWGPIGLMLGADQGTVALTRADIGFRHFRHSYLAGMTIRAGGFPMISLLYSWGGKEGTHTTFNVNTSLLGGSARPSLF